MRRTNIIVKTRMKFNRILLFKKKHSKAGEIKEHIWKVLICSHSIYKKWKVQESVQQYKWNYHFRGKTQKTVDIKIRETARKRKKRERKKLCWVRRNENCCNSIHAYIYICNGHFESIVNKTYIDRNSKLYDDMNSYATNVFT